MQIVQQDSPNICNGLFLKQNETDCFTLECLYCMVLILYEIKLFDHPVCRAKLHNDV
jgi:hypothetical protein